MSFRAGSILDLTKEEELLQIAPRPPLLSSHHADWDSIHLMYSQQPAHEVPECCLAQHILAIHTGASPTRLSVDKHFYNELYVNGDVSLFPAQQTTAKTQCHSNAEYINLLINPTLMVRFADESVDADRVELLPHLKFHDPFIQHLGLELKKELELSGADSRLYAEAMTTSLTMHLLRRYAARSPKLKTYTGGLPSYKLKTAIAYIQEHLNQNLTLAEVAAVVHMSPHYFASLFKQSVGLAPHQYITACRIEKAKSLLAHPHLSITEICHQVGFQSQSAFTRTFRKHTSTTPKAYRNTL